MVRHFHVLHFQSTHYDDLDDDDNSDDNGDDGDDIHSDLCSAISS